MIVTLTLNDGRYVSAPIVSIEDGLDEHHWDGFLTMNRMLGDPIQIVGDDLYVTNAALSSAGSNSRLRMQCSSSQTRLER